MRRAASIIWLLYVIVPVDGWGLFHGRPLGALDVVAIAAICWLWRDRRAQLLATIAGLALFAKIVLGLTLLVPRGFDARYYANGTFAGEPERGTEPAGRGDTRIESRLNFGSGEQDLPTYFFNDSTRFNFYLPSQPTRETLPVSVTWTGSLHVTRSGLHRVFVRTGGATVGINVGQDLSETIPASTTEWIGYPRLHLGWLPLRIALAIPQGGSRRFEAGWTVDGEEQPFDRAVVARRPPGGVRRALDGPVRALSVGFDAILCLCLAVGVISRAVPACRHLVPAFAVQDVLTVAWIGIVLDALWFARPVLHKMVTLSGGDDWLTYETLARDIGLHGLWMTSGAALGHGQPFYQMPLYAYFVAATHWLFGDDLYGLYFTQRLLTGATVITLWRLTSTLFGDGVGWAGLLAAGVIVYEKLAPWDGIVLTELLFTPLLCVVALLLARLARSPTPSPRAAAVAGVAGGLATLTRSTLMVGWLIALPLTALSVVRTRRGLKAMVILVVTLAAVISLATLRNWIVARQVVLISSHGSVSLFLGNEPSVPVTVPVDRQTAYDRLGLDPYTQKTIEYARQRPRAFLEGLREKAVYALGFFARLRPEMGTSLFYVTVWGLALAGLVLLVLRRPWIPATGGASLVPLSLALTHFTVIVLINATTYGDRLVLPFYMLLTPYVAIAAFGLYRFFRRRVGGARVAVALLLMLGTTACASPPSGDIRLAKATLDKAVTAGANDYAYDALKAARQINVELNRELKAQEARWVKSYDRARELAIAVQAAADKAASEARTGRQRAFEDASAGRGHFQEGPNLFRNGDFSEGLAGWDRHPESDATAAVEEVAPGERAWHVTYRKGNWSVIYQQLSLRPDTLYAYAAVIKSTAPVVALYWQSETGRFFEIDKTYREWTELRYVFLTPHWNGEPYPTDFHPVLMKGPGEVWIKTARISALKRSE